MAEEKEADFLSNSNVFKHCIHLLGPPYEVPQTEWFKQQIFIFLQFWRAEVQNQGEVRIDFF